MIIITLKARNLKWNLLKTNKKKGCQHLDLSYFEGYINFCQKFSLIWVSIQDQSSMKGPLSQKHLWKQLKHFQEQLMFPGSLRQSPNTNMGTCLLGCLNRSSSACLIAGMRRRMTRKHKKTRPFLATPNSIPSFTCLFYSLFSI